MIKEITGFSGYYISDDGKVFSTKKGEMKELRLVKSGGYSKVKLRSDNGVVKIFGVHRLVAVAFIPNPENFPCVNHKDENKTNNCVENLEWCTVRYNNNYGTRNKRVSKAMVGNKNSVSSPKVCCVELDITFDNYAACDHYIRKNFNDKWFQVAKTIKLRGGYYKKLDLHFIEIFQD